MNSPQIIAGLMETIRLQATLLSDAQDIFDELGAGTVWPPEWRPDWAMIRWHISAKRHS